jgi:hypothetical protein
MSALRSGLQWLRARLGERSTWVGVGVAVGAAAALPAPWNAIAFGVGTIGALIPDGKVGGGTP